MFSIIEQLQRGPMITRYVEPRVCCLTGNAKKAADVIAEFPEGYNFTSMEVRDRAEIAIAHSIAAIKSLAKHGYVKMMRYDKKYGSVWQRIKEL